MTDADRAYCLRCRDQAALVVLLVGQSSRVIAYTLCLRCASQADHVAEVEAHLLANIPVSPLVAVH